MHSVVLQILLHSRQQWAESSQCAFMKTPETTFNMYFME